MKKQFKGIAQEFINAMKLSFIGQGANPNDIVVQDLYNYESQNATSSRLGLKRMPGELDEFASDKDTREIYSTLLSVYRDNISTKQEIISQSRALFNIPNDIVHTTIDVMIDDGFNAFHNEEEEFKIEYILDDDDFNNLGEEYQKQVQNVIDEFVEKFSIKARVAEIVPELLRDGEHAFGIQYDENNKEGITEIVDDLDVINLLPFYNGDELAFVINQNKFDKEKYVSKNAIVSKFSSKLNESKPTVYDAKNIIFFRLNGPTKLRINMSQFYDSEFKKKFYEKTHIKLPKYIRTALPIYYGAIKLIKRLQLMEDIATVLDLNAVMKPEIVQVSVPPNTTSTEATQIVRDFERHLNENSFLSSMETLDLTTLTAQANRRKVIPQWIDAKGTLTSAAINQTSKSDDAWNAQDRLRNLIALSIGIPPFYINLSQTPIDKAQIIKLYSRYTKKLTSLQKTLAEGVKDLIMTHLQHKGINISRSNLSVKFKALTSGDSLDDTDLLVGLVSGIRDLYKAVDEITSSEGNNLVLDDEQFKDLFNDLTSRYLNISNLIRVDDHKFENIEGGEGVEGEVEFEPSSSSHRPSSSPPFGGHEPIGEPGGATENNAYEQFVNDSNEIGIPGTEPAIEEI